MVHCVLKVQSYHKNWAIENVQYFFVDTSLYAVSTETIKTWASREMTSQKICQYLTFKKNLKNMAVIQPRPTHILYQCAKCGDDRTSLTWLVTCATCLTCNNLMAYLKNWTDNFFQIFVMGTSWVAVSINNITTRASREMTSRKNIKIFDFNGVNVAKHWHVAGEVFAISDCLVTTAFTNYNCIY